MQIYSIPIQRAAIKDFADARGYKIVASYADGGKSGLTLRDRPAMRKLLEDVLEGSAPFGRLLVYDISRWGRFQDVDEGAHYEYLCRRAGVEVDYCAEPFENDGTPLSAVVKGLKRVMAAEYSRELSVKVKAAKLRLAQEGFRAAGGPPPIGYSRLMIDANRKPKAILAAGEHKAVTTYRIVLTPGPEDDQAIVRGIFAKYLAGWTMREIADRLNSDRQPIAKPRKWSQSRVRKVLIAETYIGTYVAGIVRSHLGRYKAVDPESWIRIPNAHPALISVKTFEAVQRLRIKRLGSRPTLEAIKTHAMELYKKHGKITLQLIADAGLISKAAFWFRFGGMTNMRNELGLPQLWPRTPLDLAHIARKRDDLIDEFRVFLEQQGRTVAVDSELDRLTLSEGGSIQVEIAHAGRFEGQSGWRLSRWPCKLHADIVAVALMDRANLELEGWLFLPKELWFLSKQFGSGKIQRFRGYLGSSVNDVWPHLEEAQARWDSQQARERSGRLAVTK